jgi:hypothetical protein
MLHDNLIYSFIVMSMGRNNTKVRENGKELPLTKWMVNIRL